MPRKAIFYKTSIGRKQIVAVTGLLLIGFVILHLAGNLFIYKGPAFFNMYAGKLADLRPGLYVFEFLLFLIFLVHIVFTYLVVTENIQARGARYAVFRPKERSLSTRLMPYTGTVLLLFVLWHVYDFTLTDHHGPRSIMPDGTPLGLYGVVYGSFMEPWHSVFYISAMVCLGFHLTHGIQSFFQTLGFNHRYFTRWIKKISIMLGILIAFGFSSIPVYVLVDSQRYIRP